MKIVHHSLSNGSGLHRVALNMVEGEKRLGLDSNLYFTDKPDESLFKTLQVADIHVIHSHIPDTVKGKTIFVAHGSPEHCFYISVSDGARNDALMLSLHRLNTTDITVTFWERHQYIWQSLNKKADVRCVPLGIDTKFWKPVESRGKWVGKPSALICENAHQIKWPLDIILAYPIITNALPEVTFHFYYLPSDQHRWWYPLMYANGTCFRSYSGPYYYAPDDLRNGFVSIDYLISPVRYGDFNNLCLEAKASGCKVISYWGNPFADYWICEGDQRDIAKDLISIFSGEKEPNTTKPVPDIDDMANVMKKIYEELV